MKLNQSSLLTVTLCTLLNATLLLSSEGPQNSKPIAKVEGVELSYNPIATPEADWGGDYKPGDWYEQVAGKFVTEKTLAYRKVTLEPGTYDLWLEAGKGRNFYLIIGDRKDKEAPRIRAIFKPYGQEKGVEQLKFELKLVRKKTKLKFSIRAGDTEGHGNIRIIVPDSPPSESSGSEK